MSRRGSSYDLWATERYVRHHRRTSPLGVPRAPDSFTFGYLHPDGQCPHAPACSPAGSRPFGGNEPGSRCAPQPKQAIAHASAADIIFYGGAVGGGKSEYAIVEAITLCLQFPGSKVAIFRRTLTQLEQELEGRIMLLAWADDKEQRGPNGKLFCKYNRQRHVFTFWNGSQLHLCFCNHEKDVYKYQSFQIIGLFIDESSHFTEFMVRYLSTRVRSPRKGVPKVIRLTSNPGNVGHGWHKRWFVRATPEELGPRADLEKWVHDPRTPPESVQAILHGRPAPQPFEVWRPLPPPNKPIRPDQMSTRQFIPAWFHDNFALAEADPDYLASKVYGLGGDKAKQLAEGDWDANESMIVGALWRAQHLVTDSDAVLRAFLPHLAVGQVIPWHILPDPKWRPAKGAHIFGSIDYGFGAPASIHLHAALPGGHTRTFLEFYGARKRDSEQAEILKKMLERETFADGKTPLVEGLQWVVFDPSMDSSRKEHGLAKTIIEVYQDTMPRVPFLPGAAGRGARLSRPNRWQDALAPAPDGLPWWSVTAACPDLIRTVPEVPWDEEDPDVEDDKAESHAYEDCLVAGTLVETREGPIAIDQIVAGDEVLTRDGYRSVVRAWQVSAGAPLLDLLCSDGRVLTGTAHHRIWTANRGFTRLNELSSGDILADVQDKSRSPECQNARSSFQPRFNSGAARTTTAAAAIAAMAAGTSPSPDEGCSIGGSGWTSTASSHLRSTYITATMIARTIIQTIFKRRPRTSTSATTAEHPRHFSVRHADEISASPRPLDLRSRRLSRFSARGVATRAPHRRGWADTNAIAPMCAADAPTKPGARLAAAFRFTRWPALDATRHSRHAGRASDSAAILTVTTVQPSGVGPVYDLTVEGAPEFFANGILVHNCGRFFEARPHAPRTPVVDPYEKLDPISRAHHEALERKINPDGGGIPQLYAKQ